MRRVRASSKLFVTLDEKNNSFLKRTSLEVMCCVGLHSLYFIYIYYKRYMIRLEYMMKKFTTEERLTKIYNLNHLYIFPIQYLISLSRFIWFITVLL